MKARMDSPALSVPGAFEALQVLGKAGAQGGLNVATRQVAGAWAG